MRLFFLAAFSWLLLAGCAGPRGSGYSAGEAPPSVLTDSLDPLRQQFNADKDKLRILALWSPT